MVPLLGAQGRKEEAKVSLVAPEDVGPAETEAVILARPPDEPLVVDVAGGLDGGGVIEQTHHIRMHVSYSVGDYREEGDVLGSVWLCVLAVLGVGLVLEELAPDGDATLGVRMRPSDVDDEVGVADDAGEVAAGRELDVEAFPPKYGAAVVLRRGVTPRRGQAASTAALRGLRNDAGGRMVLGSQVA